MPFCENVRTSVFLCLWVSVKLSLCDYLLQTGWNASSISRKFLAVRVFLERRGCSAQTFAGQVTVPQSGTGDAFVCAAAALTWSHGTFVSKHCKNKEKQKQS